jgi:aspartate/methionine/tyrosine aminotransferase
VAPGVDFDTVRGANYIRFSFAGTQVDVAEGMERIAGWLR